MAYIFVTKHDIHNQASLKMSNFGPQTV